MPTSFDTLSDQDRTASEKGQLKESPAAAAMGQDPCEAEMEREFIASKEKLLWAKAERQQAKERLEAAKQKEEEAATSRKRLEREFHEAEAKVEKARKKTSWLEWELESRQDEGLGCWFMLEVVVTIWGSLVVVVGCLAVVYHAVRYAGTMLFEMLGDLLRGWRGVFERWCCQCRV